MKEESAGAREDLWRASAAVAALALFAFWPILNNGFVSWDDATSFLKNTQFRGLGWEQLAWGWTTRMKSVFQPLGWWLYSAEYSVFGLNAAGYHAISLLLHALNSVLVFRLAFRVAELARPAEFPARRAKYLAASAIAAALFAAHPLRTEVVAWASGQPYLPCVTFILLAALVHLRAGARARTPRELAPLYALALGALLSKAVAVTLPCLLLALDFYPLRRLANPSTRRRAWLEKIPLFALAALFSWVAFAARDQAGELVPVAAIPLADRFLQACQSGWFYLARTVFPIGLAPIYPARPPVGEELGTALFATLALIGVSGVLIARRERWPGRFALWFAYLAILAPHAGIFRLGHTYLADRYSYLALIPWTLGGALTLGSVELDSPSRTRAKWLGAAGVLLLLTGLSWRQAATWRADEVFWTHAQANIEGHDPAVSDALGILYLDQGRTDLALEEFRHVLAFNPSAYPSHHNLAIALARQGKLDEAIAEFRAALPAADHNPEIHLMLGAALESRGLLEEAAVQYRETTRAQPVIPEAWLRLAGVLARLGRLDEGLRLFSAPLPAGPRYPLSTSFEIESKFETTLAQSWPTLAARPPRKEAFRDLGLALAGIRKLQDAAAVLTVALAIDPNLSAARFALVTVLAELDLFDRAIAELDRIAPSDPDAANAHNNLGTALAGRGRFAEAATEFRRALAANPKAVKARTNLGAALARQGKLSEARIELRRALTAEPDSIEALYNLGTLLADEKKYDEAIRVYSHALEIQPGATGVRANLGGVLALQGKFEAAVAEYERVLRTDPDNAGVRGNLAEAYRRLGKFTDPKKSE